MTRHPTGNGSLIRDVGPAQLGRHPFMFGYKAYHRTTHHPVRGWSRRTKNVIYHVSHTLRELGREKWSVRGDVIGENTPDGSRFA